MYLCKVVYLCVVSGVNPLTAGKYTNAKGISDQEEGSSKKSSASQPSRLRLFEEDEDE